MRRDDRHHILSLAGLPHTRGASISPFSMSPHRGAWTMSFREASTTSARWIATTSAPNNPSISSITEIARFIIILTSSRPSELTACTSPNAGHAYSFSDVTGHSQAGVVERSGGYGVLNNAAHMRKTTRQRTLKAGTWDLVCCPPSSLRGVFRDYPSTGRQDRWRISDTSVLPLSGPDRGSVIRDRPLCSIWTILEPHSPRVRVSGHSPYAAGRLSLHLPAGV